MKINSSCIPNCMLQLWDVNVEEKVGVFAIRNICEGEFLSFFYNFRLFGVSLCHCLCGSTQCRGSFVSSRATNHSSSASKSSAAKRGKLLFVTSTTAHARKFDLNIPQGVSFQKRTGMYRVKMNGIYYGASKNLETAFEIFKKHDSPPRKLQIGNKKEKFQSPKRHLLHERSV